MSRILARSGRTIPAALLAVVVLVGLVAGSATAAKLITGKAIKNNTVTTQDIKDGSLRAVDLSAAAKSSLKGQQGAPGVDGTNGTNGVDGKNGVSGYERLTNESANIAPGASGGVGRSCDIGKKLMGATAEFVGDNEGVSISSSETGATAQGINNVGPADKLRIVVYCAVVN
jgi:hypothetical protein